MRILKFFAVLVICCCEILACQNFFDNEPDETSQNLVLSGAFFEPREFWKKPMEEKLRFFAKPIIEKQLCNMVAKRYWWFNMEGCCCTFIAQKPKPYTAEEETIFQDAIWSKLAEYVAENDLKLSKDDFIKSLRTNIHPESRVYDAPLIHHFESRLCHKASFDQFILKNNLDK